jgi:predicted enzyme related to lactoylglutathione lyase
MNAPSYFEIQADDPSRAVRFYREIFGGRSARPMGFQSNTGELKPPGRVADC